MLKNVNFCYHPGTSLFVYSNNERIHEFQKKLSKINPTRSFHHINDSIQHCNHYYPTPAWFQHVKAHSTLEISENIPLNPNTRHVLGFDIHNIYRNIFDDNRFAEVTSLFLDDKTLAKTSFETLNKIKNRNISIILLTEVSSAQHAIELLNNKIVDQCIQLEDIKSTRKLTELVEKLTTLYFKEDEKFLHLLTKLDETHVRNLQTIFANKHIGKFYSDFFHDHNVYECYALDFLGSCLTVDLKGYVRVVVLTFPTEQQTNIELMTDNLDYNEKILNDLKQMKRIPFVAPGKNLLDIIIDNEKQDIDQYLYPCAKIEGTDFYYTIIEPNTTDCSAFLPNKLVSFFEYLPKAYQSSCL